MVMRADGVMQRRARRKIVLGGGAHAKQQAGVDAPLARGHNFCGAGRRGGDLGADAGERSGIEEVGLVQHDHVGAIQLV